jgi:hypothetical protein
MFAIVEFGSLTRKENDPYSDRDLLIICPPELRKDYLNRYETEGYSVSLLTEEQLFFMKKQGSLFLQHLKFESRVILDSGLEYSSFINTCSLVKPSLIEMEVCQKSIEYLSSWPNTPSLSAWKADFLFCLSRDYLIKRLAFEGEVAFGLKGIERIAKDIFTLREEEFICLSTLRKVKAAYRSDHQFPENFEEAIQHWLMSLNKAFNFNNNVSSNIKLDVSRFIPHNFHTPYEQLRTLEGLYLVARNIGYSHPKHQLIMNLIQKPNFYGSAKKVNQGAIRQILNEIEVVVANKAMQCTPFPLRCATLQSRH